MPGFDDRALEAPEDSVEVTVTMRGGRWVPNTSLLWDRRQTLWRVAICSLVLSTAIAFLTPKEYESGTRIMPPDQQGMGPAMLAALAGKAMPGAFGSLAGSMFGMKDTGALFVQLLQSGTVQGQIVDRFGYQMV